MNIKDNTVTGFVDCFYAGYASVQEIAEFISQNPNVKGFAEHGWYTPRNEEARKHLEDAIRELYDAGCGARASASKVFDLLDEKDHLRITHLKGMLSGPQWVLCKDKIWRVSKD